MNWIAIVIEALLNYLDNLRDFIIAVVKFLFCGG